MELKNMIWDKLNTLEKVMMAISVVTVITGTYVFIELYGTVAGGYDAAWLVGLALMMILLIYHSLMAICRGLKKLYNGFIKGFKAFAAAL